MSNSEHHYYDQLHAEKYRDEGQTKLEHALQFAENTATKGNAKHVEEIYDIVSNDRFIPAGRVQAAMGAKNREVSAFNCSVSQRIEDSMESIMEACSKAASILRLGTGIGYNFSHLRPKGDLIVKLQTKASGPVSFMAIYDCMASTIASSGHRRGAQMGILNCDHPDIEEFIDAKLTPGALRQFNVSVGVSDAFMDAVKSDSEWQLTFNGKVYKTLRARDLWDKIMRNAYVSAEPGVLFLDRINKFNNLQYCEYIEAVNPCAEQALPPNGLCLLGSFNLVGYITSDKQFDFDLFKKDIHIMVEAYDNIFERSIYALPQHREEAISKRRMGLGLTGIASAIEYIVGAPCYGEHHFNVLLDEIARCLRDECYRASVNLAKHRGEFEKLDILKHLKTPFIKTLPADIRKDMMKYGIRNSHLLSYAPCGTISQTVGNVSSGVEPLFFHEVDRDVHMKEGKVSITLKDYMVRHNGFYGKTLEECTIEDHMNVLRITQKYCDSGVSKTINVPTTCSYNDYQEIYLKAYAVGAKGITVYRPTELRGAVIVKAKKGVKPEAQQEVPEFRYGESGSCVNGACSA